MGSCGSCVRVRRGVTCRNASGRGRPATNATADGTWDRILAAAQVHDDGTPVQWTISIDSSIVRAHQHAADARKKGLPGKSGDAWCARWRSHRPVPWRTEHEDPPRRRRSWPAVVDPAHPGSGR